jgi:murein DD-endopeptidase MepM/ murein hydrolase activator NlpD
LFGAGQDAGLSDVTIMKLADVFNYDIDFAQDLRSGDTFSLIFEEVWRDGERVRTGDILAASFTNRGKRFEIYRFVDADGRADYYSSDGRSRARAFIRTPLEFSRITSRFSLGRKHPVLGTMRAHRGVDYGAPTGTPIKATGAGTVEFIGTQNGYGKVVILKHGKEFTTLYGHMSRFAKGVQRGSRVQQSQIIGYVGMTGLATGPHLHYEFRKGGAHRDPLSVDLPVADPLSGTEIARFKRITMPLIAQMGTLESTLLAVAPDSKRK